MKNIYITTAHEERIDKAFIDIASFFRNRKVAVYNAQERSLRGTFKYYAVWRVKFEGSMEFPELLSVYKNGESLDIKQFDEVL